ncbi:fimbrial biogenesis chaperone [Phytobacter ursingii]
MKTLFSILIAFIIGIASATAQAGIVVGMTRVIYPADKKEVTVNLKNTGDHAALVQSWIDMGDPLAAPESSHAPFVILPPLTRIDRGKGQTLRLLYTGGNLPEDRESIFWLNVLSVPPKNETGKKSSTHSLNIAYQTRIKIFYRPQGLKMRAEAAPSTLQWKKIVNGLSVTNPTPYYISLVNVMWHANAREYMLAGEMIAPYQSIILVESERDSVTVAKELTYGVVNDQGAVNYFTSVL